ncbi:glycosyltransferase family 2 protein [Novosphingopyxis sp. YJ-S2-01]|uniref:glycosyltransferase family 2 protein n=1 Tax=Novosphingopyxis sp. YJ-S2-01 TaxID=2794021 RepID=UPI0018DC84F9|nr:glycosyltransferase family 2 protein [Novosphingopyxis sp. YJ-S2-01]MBH9538438.1 glycosyltransferase family 2 protein [Novosphingopyxis sp. YJ-S2-01]
MGRASLVVVIPAFREERTIGPVVRSAREHADVIVVDDCSPDATGDRAREAGAIVVRNVANLGYDGTLSAGFDAAAEAGYTHIVTMDADGEHDPALVAKYREALIGRHMPLVLGVRPHKQRVAETIMGLVIRARFGANDILCGMKGYDMRLWELNGGFDHHEGIGTELAINALKAGVSFEEIPVAGTPRADAPRFDRRLRANMRIIRALFGAVTRPNQFDVGEARF